MEQYSTELDYSFVRKILIIPVEFHITPIHTTRRHIRSHVEPLSTPTFGYLVIFYLTLHFLIFPSDRQMYNGDGTTTTATGAMDTFSG